MDRNDLIRLLEKANQNWNSLSQEEKDKKIDKVIEDAKMRTERIANFQHDLKLLSLGLGIGILGNLWASLLYDVFARDQHFFLFLIAILTGVCLWWFADYYAVHIRSEMEDNIFLEHLFKKHGSGPRLSIRLRMMSIGLLSGVILAAGTLAYFGRDQLRSFLLESTPLRYLPNIDK